MAMAPGPSTYTQTEYSGNFNNDPHAFGPYAWGTHLPPSTQLRSLLDLRHASKVGAPILPSQLVPIGHYRPNATLGKDNQSLTSTQWMKKPDQLPTYTYKAKQPHITLLGMPSYEQEEIRRIQRDNQLPNTKLWQTWKQTQKCQPEVIYSHQVTTDYHYPYATASLGIKLSHPGYSTGYVYPSECITNRGRSWKIQHKRSSWLEHGTLYPH